MESRLDSHLFSSESVIGCHGYEQASFVMNNVRLYPLHIDKPNNELLTELNRILQTREYAERLKKDNKGSQGKEAEGET